ncbi:MULTISPECIES: alpha/beta hydrolase [unclassified Sphingomonas]|uniref:alpha/beta hydrolase n=1 Tax=unclassified Sphingomonas TaxID=196159 RepID=UPI0006F8BC05|nr:MULTISPECIES: alpha/beta hydrolase [unclassified Sphingomonas]KQM24823.1 lipase [Sphingomonas sp. Leaf9]KQM42481.1 lipase [Sphingomonas sp. Leaf11]
MPNKTTRRLTQLIVASAIVATSAVVVAQSPRSVDAPPPPVTAQPATQPAKAAPDMQRVLDALAGLGGKPIEALTPAQARRQPSAADGAKAAMQQQGMPTAPDPSVATQDVPYGSDAMQFARIYKPANAPSNGRLPVIVYYHGGGWVIANVETYDAAPRAMSKALNAIVVSVEYRHAPEFKFPAQHDDAAAAYRWVLQNAASWGGDPAKIAVAGESAGGNLAVATAIYARDNRLTVPRHIVSVYPIANSSMNLPSRRDSANAKPLNTPMLGWFGYYYQNSRADAQDPRLNLVAANLRGLPPTTIINAQIDPLRSDGETLAAAMRKAGVRVEQRTYPGVTHEFFGMAKVVQGAKEANDLAIARLKGAFAGPVRK